MGAVSLPQRGGIETGDALVRKALLIPGEQVRFVRPPGFGAEGGGEEVGDITNPLANPDELPVEQPGLDVLPEEIPWMGIVVDEGVWAVFKETHHLATPARIDNRAGMESLGNGASRLP